MGPAELTGFGFVVLSQHSQLFVCDNGLPFTFRFFAPLYVLEVVVKEAVVALLMAEWGKTYEFSNKMCFCQIKQLLQYGSAFSCQNGC